MGEDAIIMIQSFCSSSDNIVSIVSAGEREMIDMFAMLSGPFNLYSCHVENNIFFISSMRSR
jgi:hypothetical protein